MVYANQSRVHRLWLVSPWIGFDDDGIDPLCLLIEAVRRSKCNVFVFTRPQTEAWHSRAIELLEKELDAVIYHAPSLHTKLYIAECNGFRGAVVGSPNLTPRANKLNREIAVEFRTTATGDAHEIGAVMNELVNYASNLRGESDVTMRRHR